MFAVIRSGGKQYRVSVGDVLTLERLDAEEGASIDLQEVLLLGGKKTEIGNPIVEGAQVRASILDHFRGPKVLSFKRRRRKSSSKRLKGHRQEFTRVRILEISHGGAVADAGGAEATGEG